MTGRIAINGASGYIGVHIAAELVGHGDTPVCLLRSGSARRDADLLTSLGAKIVTADAGAEDGSLIEALRSCDRLVHLIGSIAPPNGTRLEDLQTATARRYINAAKAAGIRKVVMVTAVGCHSEARSEYHRTKWLAEEALRGSGLTWVVIRPSLVVGRTVGHRDSKLVRRYLDLIENRPRIPLVLGGKNLVQPIAVDDVARAFAAVLNSDQWDNSILEIAGPDRMSTRSFLEALMRSRGTRKGFLPLPSPLAYLIAAACEAFQTVPSLSKDQVRIAHLDAVVDDNALITELAIEPVPLAKALEAYAP